jgi:hypothetical protein
LIRGTEFEAPNPSRDNNIVVLPVRNAVLFVAGDKSGRWKEWYAEAIPAAEALYEAYLEGHR